MADPHIESPLDFWDKLTVVLYRCGFLIASVMLFTFPYKPQVANLGLMFAGVMLASSLHLYLKHFRLLLQFAMWVALLSYILDFSHFAIGAVLFVIGGLSYKEYFCFRIWGLNLQPVLLALLWVTWVLQLLVMVKLLAAICGLLLLLLSLQKWRMPLHFDIGDKSKYQI